MIRPLLISFALTALGWPGLVRAQIQPTPRELENVEVREKLGATLPLELEFKDETGAPVRLKDIFSTDETPVILTFNYSDCPMLCSVQLGGLVESMREMEWTVGSEYRIVTVLLDPTETHRKAMDTKMKYLERYQRPDVADKGWHFLTGSEESIRALAASVGFGYRYYEKEYLHPAVLMSVSPGGVVSGYLYGVKYDPEELERHLKVASIGGTSQAAQKFLLSCYHYEKPEGAGAQAMTVMRYGGLIFVVGLATLLGFFGFRRARRGVSQDAGSN
jgi:protein SCO1/2